MYQLLLCHLQEKPQLGRIRFPRNNVYHGKDWFDQHNLTHYRYEYLQRCCAPGISDLKEPVEILPIHGEVSPFDLKVGLNFFQVLKRWGMPDYIRSNKNVMPPHYTWFYKLTIGDLKCLFPLHFYKNTMFMYQGNITENNNRPGRDLIKLLFGQYTKGSGNSEDSFRYFEDKLGQTICAHADLFSTQVIITCKGCKHLRKFLAMKQIANELRSRDRTKAYNHIFVKNPA